MINAGRWKDLEHKKFIEAVILFGGNWKSVHKYVKSRTSTQARSHAQKFLVKLKKKLKILPVFDHASKTIKLTHESIDKIIKEIVDSSSMRGKQIMKEKLVKMIMSFTNLLVGKTRFSYVTRNNSGNVFNIEKTKRRSKHFLIEKIKKDTEIKTSTIQISQEDLWKLLQQNKNLSSQNQNIFNIISINIKKNGETLPDFAIVEENNFAGNVHDNLKPAELKTAESNESFVNNLDFGNFSESRSRLNNASTLESPGRLNFFAECYQDALISYGFSVIKEEEDANKYFW